MEIYLNKDKTLKLCTDGMNSWVMKLEKPKLTKDGKQKKNVKNEQVWRNATGYYAKLDQCIESLLNQKIFEREDTLLLTEALDVIKDTCKEIRETLEPLQKEFTMRRVIADVRKPGRKKA